MRKKIILPAAILILAALTGCVINSGPRELSGERMTVYLPRASAGLFTGTLADGMAEGVLESPEGWRFQGSIAEGKLLSGAAEALPCPAVFQETELQGQYTGPMADGLPEGEGSFISDGGTVFTGSFRGGCLISGDASELPLTVNWDGAEYSGVFSGTIKEGAPEGEGSFSGSSAARQTLVWEGSWSGGRPSGDGLLQADKLVTSVEGEPLAGSYAGEGRDGLPEGEGIFSAVNGEGIPFTYEGQWAAGRMEGQGLLRYESEDYYLREGTFTAGSYTPGWMEALTALGTCEPRFTLTGTQREYIAQFPALWEEEVHQTFLDSPYVPLIDWGLTMESCFADPEGFREDPRWMRIYSLRTLRSEDSPVPDSAGAMTCILAADGTYTMVVRVIIPERLEPLIRGQRFHVHAMPIAVSEYTNVLGEKQPCLVLLAGDIYIGNT